MFQSFRCSDVKAQIHEVAQPQLQLFCSLNFEKSVTIKSATTALSQLAECFSVRFSDSPVISAMLACLGPSLGRLFSADGLHQGDGEQAVSMPHHGAHV